jgi:16S rRNA G966 N2-methylase RsmD
MSEQERRGKKRRNVLNDLSGTEWIRSTKTWFELECDADPDRAPIEPGRSWLIVDSRRYHRNRATELHPARYPEELVREFVLFFTKAGEWVLDPFVGSGATLVAALETGRNAVGVELSERYANVAAARISQGSPEAAAFVREGDARRVAEAAFWAPEAPPELPMGENGLPQFDFVMTSPPYWDMLHHSRGGVESTHKRRAKKGLDTAYSDDPADLGNVGSYEEFVGEVCGALREAAALLRPGRYMVVVAQNLRAPSGQVVTLAWDIQRELSRTLQFQGERIWCQNSKRLGIWGYPTVFVPNYHHHYCLIFRRGAEG